VKDLKAQVELFTTASGENETHEAAPHRAEKDRGRGQAAACSQDGEPSAPDQERSHASEQLLATQPSQDGDDAPSEEDKECVPLPCFSDNEDSSNIGYPFVLG
jgi:hypothetical protein